jgi:glutathione synthase/RimK-type ligase-like ATP-grasp enzyme
VILIVSNARDLTTDFVVLELQRRGVPYVRLNAETLPRAAIRLGAQNADDWSITLDDRRIDGAGVTAAYFRRPGEPEVDPGIADPSERSYASTEWSALLKSLYARLGAKWLNAPSAIVAAEDKPLQLMLAESLGFNVPESLVTNDPEAFEAFLAEHAAVAKPLRQALLDGETEKVIFTSRIDRAKARDPRAIAMAPMILQREVAKRSDIRVTVVGNRVFAASIESQGSAASEGDWRQGDGAALPHAAIQLPEAVHEQCVELVRAMNLLYGAIDLIHGQDGEYWFLEINPNGQWAWIETRTGQPIAAAIVDMLQAIGTP